ncbi:non-ribosomal peptide synthetase, partial [Myxococcota bacterium]|nr:non-ribosomal peptide synthetase [Myxococcota bacterium]
EGPRPWSDEDASCGLDGSRYRTGDLGFVMSGELYVCGREKDLMIVRGQNIYPQDVEAIAERTSNTGIPNSAIAFSVPDDGGAVSDNIVVLVGVSRARAKNTAIDDLATTIKSAVTRALDVAPHLVGIVPDHDLPKTSSGKVRRAECKRRWLHGEIKALSDSDGTLRPDHKPLYPLLDEKMSRLEDRNLAYRFDLEGDVAWHRIEEPGRYYSDDYLIGIGVDPEVLKTEDGALEYFERGCAYMNSRTFVTTETAIGSWLSEVRQVSATTRSLKLLEEEETKHVALFQRYAERLADLYPEQMEDFEREHRITAEFLETEILDPENFESELNRHYEIWLAILYLEEHTTWMHEVLRSAAQDIQPCWYDAHYVHQREETQHVLTDYAYLEALAAPESHVYRWSARLFSVLFDAFAEEHKAMRELTERRFPNLKGRLQSDPTLLRETSRAGYSSRLFRRTRAAAPFLDLFARSGTFESGVETTSGLPARHFFEIERWLYRTVAQCAGTSVDRIRSTQDFRDLGLDSLGHLSVSAGLELNYGFRLSGEFTYENSTIESLMEALRELDPAGGDHLGEMGSSNRVDDAKHMREELGKTGRDLAGKMVLHSEAPLDPVFWLGGFSNTTQFFVDNFPRNRSLHLLHHQGHDGQQAK